MSFARVARVLAVLTVLCACGGGSGDTEGPLLPVIDLPHTTVGLEYEIELTAQGGVPPLRYSVNEVPEGFSFYSDSGLLTGPAAAEGEFTLNVGVTDAEGAQDTREYTLRVYAAPTVATETVPEATAGASYKQTLSSSGGLPPLRWTLADGSLPSGMTLSSDGVLSGVPRAQGGYPFAVRVQDGNGALGLRRLILEVRSGTDGGVPPDEGVVFPLQVGNWNIEWFGDATPGNGPSDEALQRDNVRTVINGVGADFWGLQEVVDATRFSELKQALSSAGYDGFMAGDPRVTNGSSYYFSGEQQLAVLYKSQEVEVRNAEIILGSSNSDFAFRPPLRVDLRVTRNGRSVDLVAIVLHMKAEANQDGYDRRKRAGAALKQYIATNLPTARVLVLGDWNDDVDGSIFNGQQTPYQSFLDEPTAYTFLTQELSQTVGSQVGFQSFIDHQLVTNELASSYVAHSARVLRPDIPSYASTTSDHYPILSRFNFGQASP